MPYQYRADFKVTLTMDISLALEECAFTNVKKWSKEGGHSAVADLCHNFHVSSYPAWQALYNSDSDIPISQQEKNKQP